MTIARLEKKLGARKEQSIFIKMIIPEKLQNTFKSIHTNIPIFMNDESICLNDLRTTLSLINEELKDNNKNENEKVLLEKYKTCLIKSLYSHLDKPSTQNASVKNKLDKKPSGILHWIKIGFLVLVSFIGLVEGSIGGFLGTNQLLLQVIPQISNFWLTAITLAITTINVILFIAFEVDLLKNLLGVKTRGNAIKVLQSHEKQIDLVGKLNNKIQNTNILSHLTSSEFRQFIPVICQLNNDLELKKKIYKEYKEPRIIKGLRWTFTGLGAIICGFSSYWGAASLISAIAAPLLGTPIGWAIIATLVLSSLIFYFAMQGNSMTNLLNSSMNQFNKIKDTLSDFEPKRQNEFDNLLLSRHRFKQPGTQNPLIDGLDLHHHQKPEGKNNPFFFRAKSASDEDINYRNPRPI